MPSNMFLSSVAYLPDKRQIVAEFSNLHEKRSERYSFFPKAHYSLEGFSEGAFREALSCYGLKRVKYFFSGNVATVFCATFSDLKALNNVLQKFFGFRQNLVEPERQFLIEKGWNYFHAFDFSSGFPEKGEGLDFPDVFLPAFADSLGKTLSDLLKSDKKMALDLAEKISLSRLIKVPLTEAQTFSSSAETFLENIFFESSAPVFYGKSSAPKTHEVCGKTSLDFSSTVLSLASKPLGNLGFESLNCECCKPASIEAGNVLPSTSVNARFLQEGFYFDSVSSVWSEEFHANRPLKDRRFARRAEYSYNFFPSGPIDRNQAESVLLADARILEKSGLCRVESVEELKWHCMLNESRFSSNINLLKNTVEVTGSLLKSQNASVVASKGLFFSQVLETIPEHFYWLSLKGACESIVSKIPSLLCSPESRFFSRDFAITLESLNGLILKDFEGIAASFGSRFHAMPKNGSFAGLMDSDSSLSVLKQFSDSFKLEKPVMKNR